MKKDGDKIALMSGMLSFMCITIAHYEEYWFAAYGVALFGSLMISITFLGE